MSILLMAQVSTEKFYKRRSRGFLDPRLHRSPQNIRSAEPSSILLAHPLTILQGVDGFLVKSG